MSSGAVVVGLWSVPPAARTPLTPLRRSIILEPGKTVSQNVSPGIQITNVSVSPLASSRPSPRARRVQTLAPKKCARNFFSSSLR